jgi:hypothetical protein
LCKGEAAKECQHSLAKCREYEDIQTRTSDVSGNISATVFMTCTTRPSDSTTS